MGTLGKKTACWKRPQPQAACRTSFSHSLPSTWSSGARGSANGMPIWGDPKAVLSKLRQQRDGARPAAVGAQGAWRGAGQPPVPTCEIKACPRALQARLPCDSHSRAVPAPRMSRPESPANPPERDVRGFGGGPMPPISSPLRACILGACPIRLPEMASCFAGAGLTPSKTLPLLQRLLVSAVPLILPDQERNL